MPNFTKIIDQFRHDLADTPEKMAFEKGYDAGKRQARRELWLYTLLVLCLLGIVSAPFVLNTL